MKTKAGKIASSDYWDASALRYSDEVRPRPIRVQISGNRVTASIADTSVTAQNACIVRKKGSFNLFVGGDAIDFRAFRLSIQNGLG